MQTTPTIDKLLTFMEKPVLACTNSRQLAYFPENNQIIFLMAHNEFLKSNKMLHMLTCQTIILSYQINVFPS